MKALKFIINGEEQEIPQGWWDGIGRTLYVKYDGQTSKWVLVSDQFVTTTINDIQNNVVLVFKWSWDWYMPGRIYDSNGDYIDISWTSLSDWDSINSGDVLIGIIKKETSIFDPSIEYTFYPRYWGTKNMS
jgi:hypothetical protein